MVEKDLKDERIFYTDRQHLDLSPLEVENLILDIGGGGEGIIGRLNGSDVISIDLSEEELKEAPPENPKIVMDARNLGFLDDSFFVATSFFTLLYVDRNDRKKIFEEAFRVLKPGGKFEVWDVLVPKYEGGKKDVFVVPVTANLSGKTIETGYGVSWEGKEQDREHFLEIADKTGFELEKVNEIDKTFHMIFRKAKQD